jgi:hypothetical protein
MQKERKSYRISEDIVKMLEHQAVENRRSMAGQIEYLILQEEKKNK